MDMERKTVVFQLFDHDKISKNDAIGEVRDKIREVRKSHILPLTLLNCLCMQPGTLITINHNSCDYSALELEGDGRFYHPHNGAF